MVRYLVVSRQTGCVVCSCVRFACARQIALDMGLSLYRVRVAL